MNKKQKILTVIGLAVFGAIILLHQYSLGFDVRGYPFVENDPGYVVIRDVRMPLFVLAVFYAGLFFILATPRAKGP